MVKIEPKACPFCSAATDPVQMNSRHYNNRTERDYYLECEECDLLIGYDIGDDYHVSRVRDLYGDITCKFSTKKEALDFWNNRA